MTSQYPCVSRYASMLAAVMVVSGLDGVDAQVLYVPAGGSLQQALNSAQPGDTILLQEGAEFIGNFVLPVKTGDGWITVRSSAPDSALPAAGTRIRPAHAPLLARVRSPNALPALRTVAGSHHWALRYIEFAANQNGSGDLIRLGDGSSEQSSLEMVPRHFTLQHLFVHGDPVLGQKRCIALNAAHVTISDSHVSDCKGVGQDTQAIGGWNGPGPFTIENNYLEGAGENVMFGGADPAIPDLVPTGITFRRNYVSRPMSWRSPIVATPQGVVVSAEAGGSLGEGLYAYRIVARQPTGSGAIGRSTASPEAIVTVGGAGSAVRVRWDAVPDATAYRVYGRTSGGQSMYWTVAGGSTEFLDTGTPGTNEAVPTSAGTVWTVKNLFELKNARDVLIEDNLFENHWKDAQPGYAIVFTPRNSGGACTWCVVENVRFEWNLVRNVGAGINLLGYDVAATPTRQTTNIAFRHNVFTKVSTTLGGNGWFMQIGERPRDVILEHNTIDHNGGSLIYVYGGHSTDPAEVYGLQMMANAARHGSYGMNGSYFSYGNAILANYYPQAVFLANYLAGGSSSRYPAGTLVAGTFPSHFVDAAGGDFTLVPGSVLARAAPDGSDIGVDYPALAARLDGVTTGVPSGSNPPPPPHVPPTAALSFTCSYLECSFSDTSTPGSGAITNRLWTFGDGTTSSESSGTHAYPAANTYTVTLAVTDANGLSDTEAATVTVAAPPPNVAPAAAFSSTCTDLTCSFVDRSTDSDGRVASWAWTFGSAGAATSPSPSFRFPSPGTYAVTLTIADDDGAAATATASVDVRAAIHSAIVATRTEIGGSAWIPWWKATVTTEVHGADERPIAGATLSAAWSGGWSRTVSCVTNTAGRCTFTTSAISGSRTSVTFTVTGVTAPLSVPTPAANHNGTGSGTSTSVTIGRPPR